MAKKDLFNNEDFQAYQADLRRRLQDHVTNLHHTLMVQAKTWEDMQIKMVKAESLTAVIAEIELILGLPAHYLAKEQAGEGTIKKERARLTQYILETFQRVFTISERKEVPGT